MRISKDEVKYVARLARLSLNDDQLVSFTEHFDKILDYIAQLNELNVSNVTPTSQSISSENVLREDIVDNTFKKELSLSNAPLSEGGFFKVPKVIE